MKHKLAKQIAQKYSISADSKAFTALIELSELASRTHRKQIRALARKQTVEFNRLNDQIDEEIENRQEQFGWPSMGGNKRVRVRY